MKVDKTVQFTSEQAAFLSTLANEHHLNFAACVRWLVAEGVKQATTGTFPTGDFVRGGDRRSQS